MTPRDLIAAFDVLAEAPDGVKRLRELVLELAVRGKLVEQDAADEPAEALLQLIERRKETLRKDRLIGKEKPVSAIPIDDLDVLPRSWCWCRAAQVMQSVTSGSRGWAEYYTNTGATFLRIGNLDYGTRALDLTNIQHVSPPAEAEGTRTRTEDGDVLVSITGDTGMVGVVPPGLGEAYINQHIAMSRPVIREMAHFLALAFMSPHGLGQFWSRERGIKNSLGLDDIRDVLVPLPPLAEQRRIVARVDELMALLDRLEAAREAREALRRAARDSALAALRDAEDAEAVEAAWQRIAGQMDHLFTASEEVMGLRVAVHALAVRGRLSSRDSRDVPAAEALRLLARARERAIALNEASPLADLSPVAAHEEPFGVPDGWSWCRLQDLTAAEPRAIQSGPFGSALLHSEFTATGRLVIGIDNVQDGWFSRGSENRISEEKFIALSKFMARPRDLLVTVMGTVGRCCLVPAAIEPAIVTKHVYRLTLDHTVVAPEYLLGIMRMSPLLQDQMFDKARGGTRSGLNGGLLRSLIVPIPPLAEQHRIVARVDALMALCDQLEARLQAARDLQASFAASAVHHLDL